jgi:hypothetical protein
MKDELTIDHGQWAIVCGQWSMADFLTGEMVREDKSRQTRINRQGMKRRIVPSRVCLPSLACVTSENYTQH